MHTSIRIGLALILLSVAGCTHPGSGSSTTTCEPGQLGLGSAKPVPFWKPPQGCKFRGSSGGLPIPVRSDEALRGMLSCTGGDVPLGVDFGATDLVVASRQLPPAGVGFDVVDDGTTVTFIDKQRRSCPGDPHPMPMSLTFAFLLPAGATRVYAETVCMVDSKC